MTLEEYLMKNAETISSFSRRTGISRTLIHRIINGHSVNLRTRGLIYKATDGQVDIDKQKKVS